MKKVMVFGTFDIIHPGHEFFLKEAKKLGDHLTIVVARDETVQELKGLLPRVGEETRLKNLKKLGVANKVILGSLTDKFSTIKTEKPNVIALGHDQRFFVDALKRLKDPKFTIRQMPGFHPKLFKTSKIAPRQPKQLLVVLGVVVKNRRLLLLKRVDPRPAFNGMWELPGGGVEYGEGIEQALKREVFEEAGFRIEVKEQLAGIPTIVRAKQKFQIFPIAFVVKPTSGQLKMSSNESSDARWCTLAKSLKIRQFALNKKMIRDNIKLLKKYVD
jgi:FAD synthetase